LLSALPFTFVPLSLKYITDEAVMGGNYALLNTIILVLVGTLTAMAVAEYVETYCFFRFQQETIFDIQRAILDKMFRLPKSFFDSSSTGYLTARGINDAYPLSTFFSSTLVNIFTSVLQLLITIGILVYLNWKLTLLSVAVVPLFVLASKAVSKTTRRLSHASFEKSALVIRDFEESLSSFSLIKSFAAEERESSKIASRLREAIQANRWRVIVTAAFAMVSTVINAAGMALVMWYGATLVIDKQLTVGELLTFCASLGFLIKPARFLASVSNAFQPPFAALERVFDILALRSEDEGEEKKQAIESLRGKIKFEQVSFRYEDETEALKDISFEVEPGQIVALVGLSGAGKSTLINLILGLYRPTSGNIYVDNVSMADVNVRSLRQRIGVVSQETLLFNETIKNNLRYGRHDATDEEVVQAARTADADEFIRRLPDGYETKVGEKGVRLSVGQKQRLSIARAILKNPDIFIFDEATSALDAITEDAVKTMLQEFCRGRTVFVIAHHLSTVMLSDVILTLDKGRIVQRGTHEELFQQEGLYRQLSLVQLLRSPSVPSLETVAGEPVLCE
jgi:subfamily B ATP-binding cassette protein MsbA